MVDQVTFPPSIGGSGKTYTNDANPQTGMFNGGHRVNFFPILADTVAAAGYVSRYAQEIDGAKANADKAEDAKAYVEAVANEYKLNILQQFRQKAVIDLDFARGLYRLDNGLELSQTTDAQSVVNISRSAIKNVHSPAGILQEVPIDQLSRAWQGGVPVGALIEPPSTNNLPNNNDLLNASYTVASTTDMYIDSEQTLLLGANVYRLNANTNMASLLVSSNYSEINARSCFSVIVKPDQCENLLLIYRSTGFNDIRVVIGIRGGVLINSQGGFSGQIFHEYLGNGFYEIGYEDAAITRHSSVLMRLQNGESSSVSNMPYSVGDGGWLALPQVETLIFPTSRIITGASPVMRGGDMMYSLASVSSFTVIAKVLRKSNLNNSLLIKLGDDDGLTGFNGLGVQSETAGAFGSLNFRLGSDRVQSSVFPLPLRSYFTIGISFSIESKIASAFIDGLKVAEIDLSDFEVSEIKSVIKKLYVFSGDSMGGAFNQVAGTCSYVVMSSYAAADAELEALTSQ